MALLQRIGNIWRHGDFTIGTWVRGIREDMEFAVLHCYEL